MQKYPIFVFVHKHKFSVFAAKVNLEFLVQMNARIVSVVQKRLILLKSVWIFRLQRLRNALGISP